MATITKPAISLYPYYDSISYATTGSYMVFIPGGGNSLRVRPCARYDSSNSTYTYFLTFGQDCSNNAVHLAYDLSTALTLSDFYDLGWDSTLDSSHYNGYGVEIKRDDSGHYLLPSYLNREQTHAIASITIKAGKNVAIISITH